MGFITGQARMEHTGINGTWKILDNQLYQDGDTLYIVPRNFYTDNYTIPNWIAWAVGSGDDRDVRPSHFHDLGCWFHAMVEVTAPIEYLRECGFVKEHICHDGEVRTICENIPIEFLKVVDIKKTQLDNLFKRMMVSTGNIKEFAAKKIRAGVFFNVGWLFCNHDVDLEKFYECANPEYLKK